ncbi:MAG: hypothetical protein ACFFB5_16425 [Promethearchaeota archaeon]
MMKRRSVSPVLATVIIFGLIITGVMITFVQVIPYIEQAQSEEAIAAARNSFLELDSTIKALLSESGTPGGFRTVLFSKPAGTIHFIDDRYHFSLRLLDQDDNIVHEIFEEQEIGALDWIYNSPRSVLPRGSTKYLTGPDPYKTRDPIFLTGVFSSVDYQDLTNLTLSHLDDRRHHITLNYRISIYLTILTQPEPEIRFEVFLILLSADFDTINTQFQQITVHATTNYSTPHTLTNKDGSIASLELVWDNIQPSGISTTSIWSTHTIPGFTVQYFNIVVQTLVYEIGLSTS